MVQPYFLALLCSFFSLLVPSGIHTTNEWMSLFIHLEIKLRMIYFLRTCKQTLPFIYLQLMQHGYDWSPAAPWESKLNQTKQFNECRNGKCYVITALFFNHNVGGWLNRWVVVWLNLFFSSRTTLVQERLNCVQWSLCNKIQSKCRYPKQVKGNLVMLHEPLFT